jgi:hypothetical protein
VARVVDMGILPNKTQYGLAISSFILFLGITVYSSKTGDSFLALMGFSGMVLLPITIIALSLIYNATVSKGVEGVEKERKGTEKVEEPEEEGEVKERTFLEIERMLNEYVKEVEREYYDAILEMAKSYWEKKGANIEMKKEERGNTKVKLYVLDKGKDFEKLHKKAKDKLRTLKFGDLVQIETVDNYKLEGVLTADEAWKEVHEITMNGGILSTVGYFVKADKNFILLSSDKIVDEKDRGAFNVILTKYIVGVKKLSEPK